jgi:hypothetical protein
LISFFRHGEDGPLERSAPLRDNSKLEHCRSRSDPPPEIRARPTANPHGLVFVQDFHLLEELARQNRKRIPELIVHAKDSTAYGTMTVPASTPRLGISGLPGTAQALTFGTKAAGDGPAR